jgi:hypothetical protein
MSYEEHIDDLFVRFAGASRAWQKLTALTNAVGCAQLEFNANLGWHIQTPPQPGLEHEMLVRESLVKALRLNSAQIDMPGEGGLKWDCLVDSLSLVDGLARNRRWTSCLCGRDESYALAYLFTRVMSVDGEIPSHRVFREQGAISIVTILNDWIPSATFKADQLSMETLLSALFGRAWYALTIQDVDPEEIDIAGVVRATRPPFVGGLLPEGLEDETIALPALW